MNDNQQYWINQNGVQVGPVTLEELKQMSLTEAAYVWHEGLSDWQPITAVPELAALLPVLQPVMATEKEPVAAADKEMGIPASPQQEAVATTVAQPQQQPCPPTNLVWAIIATILCCIPLGIVAIYYANKVSRSYYEGNLAAAERYSEVGAWWCIGAIVAGIVFSPFVSLLQMVMMG